MAYVTLSERSLQNSAAAYLSWAKTADPTKRTQPGREGLCAKFEHEADPKRKLAPAERARRATALYRAHFKRMSANSAIARRRNREARQAADELKAQLARAVRDGVA